MDADQASSAVATDGWMELLTLVRGDVAAAVEQTIESTRTMRSYDDLAVEVRRELVRYSYAAVLEGLEQRRRPGEGDDGAFFETAGEIRARQGVAIREMLTLWRLGLEHLHELAGAVAPVGPEREALLLEFLELALAWADFAMLHAAEGHRLGELSQARERQHARTNLVRRVLAGTSPFSEIRNAVTSLGLDPDAAYHAVRARPEPAADMDAIEAYLGADGLVIRGNGLVALIDGDACGFIRQLPRGAAPLAVGVSDPVGLAAMEQASRQAGRALQTALALGAKGTFDLAALGLDAAIASDVDVGEAMVRRYLKPLDDHPGGSVLLKTVECYLANNLSVESTAQDLGVHVNTVRQRLGRAEALTGHRLRETETIVEFWWALQRRRFE
jgi:hypothetical protein